MTHQGPSGQLSRRQALRLAGGTATAAIAGNALTPGALAPTGTGSPVPVTSPAAITIVPTGAQLPTEPTNFTWMVRGDGPKGTFYEKFFPQYEQAHPNITVQYDGLPPAELTRLLPLGIRNGNAPDCFEVTDTIPAYQMVREGWVQPVDDILPNFEEWKATVPPGVLVDGITVFDGKVYGFPYLSNKVYQTLILYNTTYMQQAGYDPSTEGLTWHTFREAARKITEQGQSDYWVQKSPEFTFDVSSQPVPGTGTPLPISIGPGAWLPLFIYAETANPQIAGDIFAYLGSEEGQTALATITGGFPMALSASAREKAEAGGAVDSRMSKDHDLFDEQVRTAPDPRVRNPAVEQVYRELQPVTPNFGETVQGIYTGQLGDARQAMQELQDREDAELERAIEAARGKGAEVLRDDWVFPNWDPTRDDTNEDYAALGGFCISHPLSDGGSALSGTATGSVRRCQPIDTLQEHC